MSKILTSSPWGSVQRCSRVTDGIVRVHTAGHGGFKLSAEFQHKMPPFMPATFPGGWYEEDCDWAKIAAVFPHFFTPATVAEAVRVLKIYENDNPEAMAYVAAGDAGRIANEYNTAHADHWRVSGLHSPPLGYDGWLVRFEHRTHTDQVRRLLMPGYPAKSDYTADELAQMHEPPLAA